MSHFRSDRDSSDKNVFEFPNRQGGTRSMLERAQMDRIDRLLDRPQWVPAIPDLLAKRKFKKVEEYDYWAGECLAMTRVLYVGPPSALRLNHRQLAFTEALSRDSGYWVCDCLDAALPTEDRQVDQYPLYRIDDAISRLDEGDYGGIWIVPDERSCERARAVEDHPSGPIPCTCLFALERTRIEDHDLEPLRGKQVLLIARQDESGRQRMERLGRELRERGVDTELCLMPGDSGATIGDVIARDGVVGARDWLRTAGIMKDPGLFGVDFSRDAHVQNIEDNDHFTILGLVGDDIAVRIKRTHELTFVPRPMLTNEGHLIRLAPLDWWLKLSGENGALSGAQRNVFADKLNRVAGTKGFFDLDAPKFGRGAFPYGEGKRRPNVGYNLGNRLLLPDGDGSLGREAPLATLDLNLIPGVPIDLHDDPKDADYGKELVDALTAYRWAGEADAKAFLGWIVTSLIGGALPFRPALWILGGSRSGKTYLIDALDDIFGPLAAGFIRPMKSDWTGFARFDSLPCLVDGIEQDRDGEIWPRVRALVAQITTGRGRLARSGQPRCSLVFTSKERPELTTGEMQSLCFLRFAQPVADWPNVDEGIVEATRVHKTMAIRTRIIRHAPFIIAKAREIERNLLRHAANGAASREAELWGALTAGYGFLSGDYEPIRRAGESKDEYTVLRTLLRGRIETSMGTQDTIANLLNASDPRLRAEAAKHGFKWVKDGSLAIAHGHELMRKLLHDTAYANTELNTYLKGIGARVWKTARGNPERLNCGGRRRVCRVVPQEILVEVGFCSKEKDFG